MPLSGNLRPYDRDNGLPGLLAPSHLGAWNQSNVSITAGRAYFARVFPSRPMLIHSLAFYVNTGAGANDNCDVGIYSAAGVRLGSAGSTAGKLNSSGLKTINLSADVQLSAGVPYYAAFGCTGTFGGSAAQLQFAVYQDNVTAQWFGNTAGYWEVDSIDGVDVPLPSSVSLMSAGNNKAPLLVLREI